MNNAGYKMKAQTFLLLGAALVVSGAVQAQEAVTIPAAASVQQGKTSNFKYVLTGTMSVQAAGRTMPMQLDASILQTSHYGKPESEGLTPVTYSFSVPRVKGSFNGKSLASHMPRPGTFKMPSFTLYFDHSGVVRKLKVSGVINGREQSKTVLAPAASELASAQAAAITPPAGPVEIGRLITRTIEVPVPGHAAQLNLSYLPVKVSDVGGEQAVTFKVSADSTFSCAVPIRQASTAAAVPGPAAVYLKLTGVISVGLTSGEIISEDLSPYILVTMSAGPQQMDAEMDMRLQGYQVH